MKVKELIKKLQKLPQDSLVMGSGYEGGYYDIEELSEAEMVLNVNTESYYGPHEEVSTESPDELKGKKKVMAVLL